MMSKRQNLAWVEARANYTMLALIMEVDFEAEEIVQAYDEVWVNRVAAEEMTQEQLREKATTSWNVARELRVKLRAVKGN